MGRGRVQLKRIEDKISRQVTFSKRRTGLLKKAREISVLCDAQVALIVFSSNGKLFEYSAESSMEIVLERYERKSNSEQELSQADVGLQGNWVKDFTKLTSRMEVLQKNLRNCLGEELEPMSLRELQHLELQLEAALKRVRIRQNKLMHESIVELQKKAKALQEQNNFLGKKRTDEEQENSLALDSPAFNLSEPQQLALPVGHNFQASEAVDEVAETQMQSRTTNSMPPWLLHHMNR